MSKKKTEPKLTNEERVISEQETPEGKELWTKIFALKALVKSGKPLPSEDKEKLAQAKIEVEAEWQTLKDTGQESSLVEITRQQIAEATRHKEPQ